MSSFVPGVESGSLLPEPSRTAVACSSLVHSRVCSEPALAIGGEPALTTYRPPVTSEFPPHTIISRSVHTAVWPTRPDGAPRIEVGVQVSVAGSYRPPVLAYLSGAPS